jgi:hypothetical protein
VQVGAAEFLVTRIQAGKKAILSHRLLPRLQQEAARKLEFHGQKSMRWRSGFMGNRNRDGVPSV